MTNHHIRALFFDTGISSYTIKVIVVAFQFHEGTPSKCLLPSLRIQRFNPRTHIGCDTPMRNLPVETLRFNPRTHIGCDERYSGLPARCSQFQSTHPHRVRLSFKVLFVHTLRFNPRTHIGCDCMTQFLLE